MKKMELLRTVIDYLKKENSLTNEDLSLKLGYRTKSYVSDILGGNKGLSNIFLDRLNDVYRINTEFIKGNSNEMIIRNIDSKFPREMSGTALLATGKNDSETASKAKNTIHEIAESNKILAHANSTLADAHKIIARSNEQLIGIIKGTSSDDHSESPITDPTTLSSLLEAMAEIGAGKRWRSKEEAIAWLGNKFLPQGGGTKRKKDIRADGGKKGTVKA